METQILTQMTELTVAGVPLALIGGIALMLIMVTMGLTLEISDFKRVFITPRPILIGLTGQILLLPIIAVLLIMVFEPSSDIAMGLIILACCPGGATSNFFSHLARGNIAVSISLTALSGVIVIFTIPLIVNLSVYWLVEGEDKVYLPMIESIVRIFILVLLPTMIGMSIRAKFPILSKRIESIGTKLSFALILATMFVVLLHVQPIFIDSVIRAGWLVLCLNVLMMAVGFLSSVCLKISERDSRSITLELGVQNYILSIVIAVGMLGKPEYSVVPMLYLFIMYVTSFSFILYCRGIRDGLINRKN